MPAASVAALNATCATAGVSSSDVPDRGDTLSHDPPLVATVAVQFSVLPPVFPMVIDWLPGDTPDNDCTLIAEGDTVSCPGGAAVTVNCTFTVEDVAPTCTTMFP